MQVTSSSLIDCLVKNGLCTENVRLQCRCIGFHPCNRDGCRVVPSEVQDCWKRKLQKRIAELDLDGVV
jgi:hypothetical protein